jgi:L-fucose dehydrogenase
MDLQLKDKVVLVTGGAKGIGAAITKICAQEGAIAVVVDRDLPACQQLHTELTAQGVQTSFIATDLSSPENCEAVVRQVIATVDHINALVNNAGINDRVGLEHGSPQEFLYSFERNLLNYYKFDTSALLHLQWTLEIMSNIT